MKPLDPVRVESLNEELGKVALRHRWVYVYSDDGTGILSNKGNIEFTATMTDGKVRLKFKGDEKKAYKIFLGEYEDGHRVKYTVTSFLPPMQRNRSLERDIMAIYV